MTIDEMLDRVAQREGVKPMPPVRAKNGSCTLEACGGSCKKGASAHSNHVDKLGCCNHKTDTHKCSCETGSCEAHTDKRGCSCKEGSAVMDIAKAKMIADGVEIAAEGLGVRVVVAIVNDGANLMLLHAMDDSYIASIEASQKKAYTAVALKMPSHIALKESRGGSLDGYASSGSILLLGGGFPLEYGGKIVGGIGVSGGTKEQDILLAQVGAKLLQRIWTV